MSPLDSSFLHIEDDKNHMHIASVAIFEGPPPPHSDIEAMVASKLPQVPRYRQKVRFVPLSLGRPMWIDDPHFNIGYHVRRTALPPPGGDAELRRLVSRVMAQQLDRAKPLWEMWVAEGLDENRWAILSKVHHCMVDGVSGSDLLATVLDTERDASLLPPDSWRPGPEPSGAQVVAGSLAERAISPYEQLRSARAALRGPRQLAAQAVATGRGLLALRRLIVPTPQSSLNGPIGPHRRWNWATGRLSEVKAVRGALGGTVNDVMLAAITNGFRELLLSRGESPEELVVRSLVPVSVRKSEDRGNYDNRVSAMFAELPVGIADPVERLEAIREQMQGLKESKQAVAGEVLTSLTGFAPALLLALGTRLASSLPQRNVNTVTTNVPGPQFPLYAAGRRMLEAMPYVPLAGTVRVGVAIFSYDGGIKFGVTGDYDTAPDIDVVCRGIEDGLADLGDAAEALERRDSASSRQSAVGSRQKGRKRQSRRRAASRPVASRQGDRTQ